MRIFIMPLGDILLEDLTIKALFLLALASGWRRNELGALRLGDQVVGFGHGYANVMLRLIWPSWPGIRQSKQHMNRLIHSSVSHRL